jgi:hypothetical protein
MLASANALDLSEIVAGPTRLELATSGVTGRRSNQLNYDPARVLTFNHQSAIENQQFFLSRLVGGTGLEPVTAGV